MYLQTEEEAIEYGRALGTKLTPPKTIELVGDVGTGKTTITRGIAEALGISEPVTSPSFTISKHYAGKKANLIHYDFYRLPEPGLMVEDLQESINDSSAITVVEWADSVENFLPNDHLKITLELQDDGSRKIIEENLT